MAGGKRRDEHDATAVAAEVVDEIGPEVATGLDGEDEVFGQLVPGQVGQLGQAGSETLPELVVEA